MRKGPASPFAIFSQVSDYNKAKPSLLTIDVSL